MSKTKALDRLPVTKTCCRDTMSLKTIQSDGLYTSNKTEENPTSFYM